MPKEFRKLFMRDKLSLTTKFSQFELTLAKLIGRISFVIRTFTLDLGYCSKLIVFKIVSFSQKLIDMN